MPEFTEATLADVPQLTALLGILFTVEVELAPDPAKQDRALRQILSQPEAGRIYCARSGDQVLGMVSILFTISTAEGGRAAWLEDMVIHPDHRDKGLGQQLIQHALTAARTHGCTRVTLLTDGINTGAMRFYERAGFTRSEMMAFRTYLAPANPAPT